MIVPRAVLAEIHHTLEGAYPHEGCGFLVGSVGDDVRVDRQLAASNYRQEDRAAATRYLITPEEFRVATHTVAADGLEIVGVYHSHPDVAPVPSTYDREHAWPWYQYLIVSVRNGTADDMRAWQLTDDRRGFVERVVHIVD